MDEAGLLAICQMAFPSKG